MKRLIACIIATMAFSSLSAQTNPLKTFFCADFNQGKIWNVEDDCTTCDILILFPYFIILSISL